MTITNDCVNIDVIAVGSVDDIDSIENAEQFCYLIPNTSAIEANLDYICLRDTTVWSDNSNLSTLTSKDIAKFDIYR